MNPRITLYLCLLACQAVCLVSSAAITTRAENVLSEDVMLDVEERALLFRINEYRAEHGLAPLRVSYTLTRCAEWMTGDMAAKNYFDHTDSARRDPFKRMAAFGYGYKGQRGENVAAGFNDAARTFELWKNSPDHQRAMLDANYRVIGISRAPATSSPLRWVWVADFGSYLDATFEIAAKQLMNVENVHAATGRRAVAPGSIAIAAGDGLSQCTAVANQSQLPTQLPTTMCNTTVLVNGRAARLHSVSPTQVHYVVPSDVAIGEASVTVMSGSSQIATGKVLIEAASPGLFASLEEGRYNSFTKQNNARSLPNQLLLYGTGLRACASLKQLEVKVNNQPVKVRYAGAQENVSGLDQLNIELPENLQREETFQVALWVDGKPMAPVSVKAVRKDDNQRGATAASGLR